MSVKTVLSNIYTCSQLKKKQIISYIYNESSFFWFIFCFQNFTVNILPVLKSVASTWCEGWVIAVQTILWQLYKNILKVKFINYPITLYYKVTKQHALQCKMFMIKYRNTIPQCSALYFHKKLCDLDPFDACRWWSFVYGREQLQYAPKG